MCRTNIGEKKSQSNLEAEDDDDLGFKIEIITSSEFKIPNEIIRNALFRGCNLTMVLNHEEENREGITPDLVINWNVITPPSIDGWRNTFDVYSTTLMNKGVKYGIYVDMFSDKEHFSAGSSIDHIDIHIVPMSFMTRSKIKREAFQNKNKNKNKNLKRKRKQTKYRNTAQSKQRYTHH